MISEKINDCFDSFKTIRLILGMESMQDHQVQLEQSAISYLSELRFDETELDEQDEQEEPEESIESTISSSIIDSMVNRKVLIKIFTVNDPHSFYGVMPYGDKKLDSKFINHVLKGEFNPKSDPEAEFVQKFKELRSQLM